MHINTRCLHAGYEAKNGEPTNPPIVQSTTYKYESSEFMGALFDLKEDGFFYSRLANPTVDMVEKKLADLEGGVGAILTSSGQSANMYAIINICKAGDHVISSSAIYGGTFNLFNKTLRDLGIDFTFISPYASDEEIEAAFKENTKCVFGETLSNPSLDILDIERFAKIAHRHKVPLIVDNTFPTPVNCRPIEFGADIVTHSTTKYLDGHAAVVGGAVVDSGRFDWNASGLFPMLTEPDESYHGIIYVKQFGKAAYMAKMKAHVMRDIGSMMSPQSAFYLYLGLETLALRMERHCENAKKVAAFLEDESKKPNGKITWINYPDMPGNKNYELCKKYMPNGSCGVISFGIKGGREAATKFMDSLKLASICTHVADAKTILLHPASTTHRQLTDAELEACGVGPDLIRFSVGIEYIDDIIDDLKEGLAKI